MASNPHPASLAEQPCDPYVFDISHFECLLNENSRRTLVPDNQLQIKLIEVGVRGIIVLVYLAWLETDSTSHRLDLYNIERLGKLLGEDSIQRDTNYVRKCILISGRD